MSIGIGSVIEYDVPAGLDVVLPDPPQLPQLSEVFPPSDRCLDLGDLD